MKNFYLPFSLIIFIFHSGEAVSPLCVAKSPNKCTTLKYYNSYRAHKCLHQARCSTEFCKACVESNSVFHSEECSTACLYGKRWLYNPELQAKMARIYPSTPLKNKQEEDRDLRDKERAIALKLEVLRAEAETWRSKMQRGDNNVEMARKKYSALSAKIITLEDQIKKEKKERYHRYQKEA